MSLYLTVNGNTISLRNNSSNNVNTCAVQVYEYKWKCKGANGEGTFIEYKAELDNNPGYCMQDEILTDCQYIEVSRPCTEVTAMPYND